MPYIHAGIHFATATSRITVPDQRNKSDKNSTQILTNTMITLWQKSLRQKKAEQPVAPLFCKHPVCSHVLIKLKPFFYVVQHLLSPVSQNRTTIQRLEQELLVVEHIRQPHRMEQCCLQCRQD